ncbi:wsv241 [White spot syndrome virus]|uniref:Wsv241 n=3 Tax=White spot syndrome virus TaxID=342409 RepID=Q8VAX8_WSSVS|nr:wsv241 [Shrimp white spot syndrome virus]AAL33245.1 wsv241 [Shrimp white spot syndrome virus]AAL89165.1 WSSV297 [Shrimp white spot syndrome virus]AFX59618.1 wsv241 [White spot syndrome virus]
MVAFFPIADKRGIITKHMSWHLLVADISRECCSLFTTTAKTKQSSGTTSPGSVVDPSTTLIL